MNTDNQPHIRAVSMNLYPTLESIQQVMELAESKLPITSKYELHALLMTFQNTLIKHIKE